VYDYLDPAQQYYEIHFTGQCPEPSDEWISDALGQRGTQAPLYLNGSTAYL
jgi:hypothetical protein